MIHVLNILTPIFLLVAVGAFLGRSKFMEDNFFAGVNKLTFHPGWASAIFRLQDEFRAGCARFAEEQ